MMEVGLTMPQLRLTIDEDGAGAGVWLLGWWRWGLTKDKLRLDMMELRIGDGSDGFGAGSWQC